MILKTPSGYVVELKDKLNFGEMREFQKALFTGVKGDTTGKAPEIDLAKMSEYPEKAFPFIVVKITKDEKDVEGDLLKEVYTWDNEDGVALFDKITEITSAGKKK